MFNVRWFNCNGSEGSTTIDDKHHAIGCAAWHVESNIAIYSDVTDCDGNFVYSANELFLWI